MDYTIPGLDDFLASFIKFVRLVREKGFYFVSSEGVLVSQIITTDYSNSQEIFAYTLKLLQDGAVPLLVEFYTELEFNKMLMMSSFKTHQELTEVMLIIRLMRFLQMGDYFSIYELVSKVGSIGLRSKIFPDSREWGGPGGDLL